MYVAVKGGEAAIANAHRLMADRRRGDREVPALTTEQIVGQLSLSVDRVMAEGSLYDPELAAMAIRQARGDLIEAIFLLRAYRTTLPRFDTAAMRIERRVSATYKDIPGGQLLGPTFDYTHRLIDPAMAGDEPVAEPERRLDAAEEECPRVSDILDGQGLIEPDRPDDAEPADLTREATSYPVGRDLRLQALARGDEGFLLALGYSTQRGYGRTHPFVGEIRIGTVDVEVEVPELGFAVRIGAVRVTECQMVSQFTGGAKGETVDDGAAAGGANMLPRFTRGYGLVFGQSERKAMAMSLVDRALRADEFAEQRSAPAQDEEFVLEHCDNVQATGFVEHLKLPHYVDFQAELDLLRTLRREANEAARARTFSEAA
ncbi:MAG: carbon-phosphorus lyase complex subunit PhnI, partial [Sphingomonadaceae bacterium]|nr:carbon-phosphorus lyase complex subunit PhnI [Sphingomonadaceae bacterium]